MKRKIAIMFFAIQFQLCFFSEEQLFQENAGIISNFMDINLNDGKHEIIKNLKLNGIFYIDQVQKIVIYGKIKSKYDAKYLVLDLQGEKVTNISLYLDGPSSLFEKIFQDCHDVIDIKKTGENSALWTDNDVSIKIDIFRENEIFKSNDLIRIHYFINNKKISGGLDDSYRPDKVEFTVGECVYNSFSNLKKKFDLNVYHSFYNHINVEVNSSVSYLTNGKFGIGTTYNGGINMDFMNENFPYEINIFTDVRLMFKFGNINHKYFLFETGFYQSQTKFLLSEIDTNYPSIILKNGPSFFIGFEQKSLRYLMTFGGTFRYLFVTAPTFIFVRMQYEFGIEFRWRYYHIKYFD
jgi:hypothetical protein